MRGNLDVDISSLDLLLLEDRNDLEHWKVENVEKYTFIVRPY